MGVDTWKINNENCWESSVNSVINSIWLDSCDERVFYLNKFDEVSEVVSLIIPRAFLFKHHSFITFCSINSNIISWIKKEKKKTQILFPYLKPCIWILYNWMPLKRQHRDGGDGDIELNKRRHLLSSWVIFDFLLFQDFSYFSFS